MALTDKLTAIADAIRAKTGKNDSLTLEQMPTEIMGITGGGGGSSADVRYVTFMNGNTVLYKKPVAVGDDCVDVYTKGLIEEPKKESTVQYNYTYYGWGASDGGAANANILKNITEDKTVYAIFTATVRYYTITYLDSDGVTVLKTEQVAYGTVPSYTPTKEGYDFDKWTPTPTMVTGEASYTASWSSVLASGKCGSNVTYSLSTSGVLTLSGTGATSLYTYSNQPPWKDYFSEIKSVVVEYGITELGAYIFGWCTNLTSVTLPNSVTLIKNLVFSGCSALPSITIPASVSEINKNIFSGCNSLKSVFFENPNGWKAGSTELSADDLANPTTATTYLVSTYNNTKWTRS